MLKMTFMFILIFSMIYGISSENWFSMWMSLELNMLSFIPIMMKKFNFKINSLLTIKYFLIQTFSSSIFLFFSILMFFSMNNITMKLIIFFIMCSLMMKLGMSPFHWWYVKLMKNLIWLNCIILSTIQKLIPLYMISNFIKMSFNYVIYFIILSSLISTISGLNQSLLKLIMAYSSINHLSWMLMIMLINEKMFMKYLIMYSLISMKIMLMFNFLKMESISQIYQIMFNKYMKIIIMINILSLGGMPPFFGFLMKWFTLKYIYILNYKLIMIMIFMLINSIIILFYYIQIFTPTLMIFNYNNKFINLMKINMNKFIFLSIIMFMSIYFMLMNNLF